MAVRDRPAGGARPAVGGDSALCRAVCHIHSFAGHRHTVVNTATGTFQKVDLPVALTTLSQRFDPPIDTTTADGPLAAGEA
jgi:hypothetical protein